jgi:hypothetical protein
MRSRREVDYVLELAGRGLGASAIARRTGIPRSTVRDWLSERIPQVRVVRSPAAVPPAAYSHLLGLYLGDGHLIRLRRTFMLRIFFDARYPGLIGQAVRSVRAVASDQRVSVFRNAPTNCVVLRCHWNAWPQLFPQHGPGRKHTLLRAPRPARHRMAPLERVPHFRVAPRGRRGARRVRRPQAVAQRAPANVGRVVHAMSDSNRPTTPRAAEPTRSPSRS